MISIVDSKVNRLEMLRELQVLEVLDFLKVNY